MQQIGVRIITKYSEVDIQAWQCLVDESPVSTWFQTPEAYEFFFSLTEMMQPFCVAVEREGELKGVIVGYVTKEKSGIKQFFTRRAIIVGGPLLAEDITSAELKSLLSAVESHLSDKAIYIETRNFNDYSLWRKQFEDCGYEYQPHLNFHVDTSSVEVVNQNLGKNRKRDIRVSMRDGATIITSPTIEQVKSYYSILAKLYATKVRTPLFDWEFFERLYYLPSSHFLLVQFEDRIIGGTVCVELKGKTVYEWFVCGEDGKYKNIFPSELATYAGLQYAAENSCSCFDMMGAGKPEEHYGVRDFKARFGGKMVEYGRFVKIMNQLLFRIGKMGVSIMKSGIYWGGGQVVVNEQVKQYNWGGFVREHPLGTIFHTPEMYDVYSESTKQKPIVIAIEKYGKIKGLLMAVVQWNGNAFTKPMTARSIIIGGPLAVNNDAEIIKLLLTEYRKRLPWYVVYSEIRPVYDITGLSDSLIASGYKRVGHYNIVLQTSRHKKQLWDGMHKERKRNVGQAEKSGLKFELVKTKEQQVQIIRLLQQTYKRKRVPLADTRMFETLETVMPQYVHFFAAYYEGKMVAGQIRLGYKKLLYAWYAGSDEQYFKLRPNDFLMWNVICWAHKNGFTRFDFGGGGEPGKQYGVRDYKLKYGCQMYDYGRYRVLHRPIAYFIGKMAITLVQKK